MLKTHHLYDCWTIITLVLYLNSYLHTCIFRSHCLECCNKDESTSAIKRYAKARLEVCTCKFGAYPQIQGKCAITHNKLICTLECIIDYSTILCHIINLFSNSVGTYFILILFRGNYTTSSVQPLVI